MAKVTEPRLGGLTKEQEREVADQLERSLGLNPKHGWFRNIDNILANRKKISGMSDEDWDKMFRELPYYGDWQGQDVDAVQEHLLNKYPIKKFLGLPVRQKMNLFDTDTWPTNWKSIGETYGIEAGVIPSDEAYQKIMSISPDALSGVTATGLGSYEGPIAETIEWEEYKQQYGPSGVPSFDDTGITMDMMDLSYENAPLYTTEYGDSLHPTGYNYNLEQTTIDNLGYTPRYENNAMLQLNAKNAFIQLQQKFFDLHGKNFELASAYRSGDHDAAVGGKDLNHPKGNAFDVRFSLLSDKEKDDLKILGRTVGLHWANYPGSSHFNYR